MRSLLKRSLSYLTLRHADAVKGGVLHSPTAERLSPSIYVTQTFDLRLDPGLEVTAKKWAGGLGDRRRVCGPR